jgi:hypothetical protein
VVGGPQVFIALLDGYQPVFDYEDRLKNLVTKLAAHSEAKPYALKSVERLRHPPGMVQFYKALMSNPGQVS